MSFLDIMSCGFGAAVLLFLVIKHDIDTHVDAGPSPMRAEVSLLEEDVRLGEKELVRVRNTLAALEQELVVVQGEVRRVIEKIDDTQGQIAELTASSDDARIEQLKLELKRLEDEKKRLEAEVRKSGEKVRQFIGEGERQYLTGLKVGGRRILVLLDASASMLDNTIVNVIRRRNMSEAVKRRSAKWQRAVATVDWLTTQFPKSSRYQIYTFNSEVTPAVSGTRGKWLDVGDRDQLEQAVQNLRSMAPEGGTSLEKTFLSIRSLSPSPDNIYLITDGLPTQGVKPPSRHTISGRDRLALFQRAVKKLPSGVPVNIVLAPMEGDPMAASAFWELAQVTQGAFLSPSKDWP